VEYILYSHSETVAAVARAVELAVREFVVASFTDWLAGESGSGIFLMRGFKVTKSTEYYCMLVCHIRIV
jgi:hypothetical protein